MSIKNIFEKKRKWKVIMARVEKLPEDYQIVYREIQKYLFKIGPVELTEGIGLLTGIVELFENGVASGKKVLEVTGEDVALFCDELIKDSKTYTEIYMEAATQKVVDKAMKRREEK
jgi:DNA-binding ferritin-like protein (Dps family)